jgi:type I restriction enzyme S subunit
VTLSKCDGPFGSGLKSEHYADEGVRVIRLQNIRSDGFFGNDAAFVPLDYYQGNLSGHDVLPGDVLIAGLGDDRNLVGRACVAPGGLGPAMVKADCFRFRLDPERALPEFVATQLSVGAVVDGPRLATGSTRSRIPLTVTASRFVALPHPEEQRDILDFVGQHRRVSNALIAEAQTAITLLQERRAALITAAVTGAVDVRHTTTTEGPVG